MRNPKWCLFFDFHTMPACPDVGKDFDFDRITDEIKECGVDFIVFPARCNLGVAYYNTKVGVRHPSLKYDLWEKLSEACAKKDIGISAYINVGLSHEEGLLHRDWTVVTPEGYAYKPPHLSHWFRGMCYNTGYAGHLISMVKEIMANYKTSGFFFDCFGMPPCIGGECVREMKKLGMDWQNKDDQMAFAKKSQLRLMDSLSKTIKDTGKDLLIYFNGPSFEDQDKAGTYLEYECLPTGGWGYDILPVFARYARNLGKTVLNMTGRFHESWGDFGGLRTEPSLEYDCINGVANCMRTTIGDHFHPRGDINEPFFGLVKSVYGRLRKLEPWIDGAKAVTDIAVIAPDKTFDCCDAEAGKKQRSLKGGTRMLCELKQQFDVLSPSHDFSSYKLVILPDSVSLTPELAGRVKNYLKKGGAVISSAWAGLDSKKEKFTLKEWGLTFEGDSPHDPAYMTVSPEVSEGFPDMPVTLYDKGTQVSASEGADVLAEITAPFFNKHWDGEHAFMYMPPDKKTGKPALIKNGNVIHFTHPLFESYFAHAQVPMRNLLRNVIKLLLPEPLVKIEGAPSFARVTVTEQPGRRMIYIMSYVPEKRGNMIEMIEEPIELRNLTLSIRADGKKVKSVHTAPDMKKLEFSVKDGRVSVKVPVVNGYAVIVLSEK